MDDNNEHKKAKRTKTYVIKRIIKFNDYKDCLFNNRTILKSQQRFKSQAHNVYTEETNKIALNGNDDNRIMMITEYKFLIKLQHIHMKQMLSKYAKVKC